MLEPDLRIRIGEVEFSNPCLTASGTYGFGERFPQVLNRLGGFIPKGITLLPRVGNPPPRIWEGSGGIVNSIGLENPGVIYFTNNILPKLSHLNTKIILNIAGFAIEEFATLIKILDGPVVSGFELNLSCPNVPDGGISFSQNPKSVAKILQETRKMTRKLLIPKLSPVFNNLLELAHICEEEGSSAITLINSLPSLVVDLERFQPFLGGRTGGLSGPAIKPFALYCINKVKEVLKIPIIGCGGIMNYQDALEYILAGASLFQVGSANLINPFTPIEIIEGLKRYCREKEFPDIKRLINKLS